MMNLAFRDIRYNFGRFVLTTVGISMLLMVVMGMGGIYRGLIMEATLIIDKIDADIWVVQQDTRGPFAEVSKIPRNMEYRIAALRGVQSATPFISHTVQRDFNGGILRLSIQGVPDDGGWLPLAQGRILRQGHFEMIADQSAKLPLGTRLPFGKDMYEIVGITRQMNSPSGDAMVFVSVNDALAIQTDVPAELIRKERESRVRRFEHIDFGSTAPEHADQFVRDNAQLAAIGGQQVSAILVKVTPGFDKAELLERIDSLPEVTAYTAAGQREIMLQGFVARSRKQLLLFRTILITVSTVIMTLILYTLTLDKLHDIAMLKLIGARNGVILRLIMQQALLIGVGAFFIARFCGEWIYPWFPRRVVLISGDLWILFGIVVGISLLASIIGVIKALKVDPGEILS